MERLQTWWVTALYMPIDGDSCMEIPGDCEVVKVADAQATIAALQARVKELEEWVQDQSTANLETMRHMDEMQSRAMDAESQLTQRTAELEAAKRERDVWYARYNELSGVKDRQLNDLQAELERVRGEQQQAWLHFTLCNSHADFIDDLGTLLTDHYTLRTLIAALPKVEGEIEVYTGKNTNQVVVTYNRGIIIGTLYGLDHAKPVADLYKHRQGMEGVNES